MRQYKEEIKDIIRDTAEGCIDWKPWKTDEISLDNTLSFLDLMNIPLEDDSDLDVACMLHDECLKEVQTEYDVELS